jgi:hypothetical protein
MRTFQGLTLGCIALALALVATAAAVAPVTITTFVVSGSAGPGVSTGLVLDGDAVTVTATGTVCPNAGGVCAEPDGDPAVDTTRSAHGGFPAPGEPAWGLVGRVGTGPWLQVGSGPTTISGTGVVELAVNDDTPSDNAGYYTLSVSPGAGRPIAEPRQPSLSP